MLKNINAKDELFDNHLCPLQKTLFYKNIKTTKLGSERDKSPSSS